MYINSRPRQSKFYKVLRIKAAKTRLGLFVRLVGVNMEEWKSIPEFNDYQVSNFGRIRALMFRNRTTPLSRLTDLVNLLEFLGSQLIYIIFLSLSLNIQQRLLSLPY